MTTRTVYVIARIEVDTIATVKDVKTYVDDAIAFWGGSSHPEDVFFSGNIKTKAVWAGLDDPRARFRS